MERMRLYVSALLLTVAVNGASADSGYCRSYNDLIAGKWMELDSVVVKECGQGRKMWLSTNDYNISTADEAMTKRLKKEAFAIMHDGVLYFNSRKLVCDREKFRKGYTKAWRYGEDGYIIMNEVVGKEARMSMTTTRIPAGSNSKFAYTDNQLRHRVCYLITGESKDGKYMNAYLIDDAMMEKLIGSRSDLYAEYYSEETKSERIMAKHVFPILVKMGLAER